MAYRILSLDGGGLRGQWAATILRRLDEALPDLLDKIDLFAGASIGAVLALALAGGYKPHQLEAMFLKYGPQVFQPSRPRIPTKLRRFYRSGYSTISLNRLLEEYFGDTKLGGLSKHVVVPVFKLDNPESERSHRSWKPVVFHNYRRRTDNHCQMPVSQVVLCATATPTIFPSVDGYVDGGLVANNPSMIALTHLQEKRYCEFGRRNVEDIVLFSIGTGCEPQYIDEQRVDWGYIQWMRHLIDLMNSGSIQLVDQQCRQILDGGYHRLCPALPKKIHAYDTTKLEMLKNLAESVDLTQTICWLKENYLDHQPDQFDTPPYAVAALVQ